MPPWKYHRITNSSFWTATLKRLGIRHRRPYNTRHTYASLALMSGANAAYMAKQMGHSTEMFFKVYADWINGADDDREMEKIENAIRQFSPGLALD
jgi:integrase